MTSASETEAPPQSFCFGFYSAAHAKKGAGIWLDAEGREQTVTHVFDEVNPEDLASIPGIQRRGILVKYLRPVDSESVARLALLERLTAAMHRRQRVHTTLYNEPFLMPFMETRLFVPEKLDPPTIVIDDIGKRRYDLIDRVEKSKK